MRVLSTPDCTLFIYMLTCLGHTQSAENWWVFFESGVGGDYPVLREIRKPVPSNPCYSSAIRRTCPMASASYLKFSNSLLEITRYLMDARQS